MNEIQEDKTLEAELQVARTETVAISEADFTDAIKLAEEIGKFKMSRSISSGLRIMETRWLGQMRDSKMYQKYPLSRKDGSHFFAETFEEFCQGLGVSYRTVAESLQNFATLGAQYYEESQNLGLKVRDLRKVRKALKDAPEDVRDELFIALREVKDSPEELRTTLDVLCARYLDAKKDNEKLVEEKVALQARVDGLASDYRAQSDVLSTKIQQYDELNEKFIRATSPIPADVILKQETFQENARKMLDESCLKAIDAVNQMGLIAENIVNDGNTSTETARYVHERVSQAVAAMGDLLRMRTDVDFMAEFRVDFGPESVEVEG